MDIFVFFFFFFFCVCCLNYTFHCVRSRGVAERKYTYNVSSSGVCSCISYVAGVWCNEIKKTVFVSSLCCTF